MNQKTTKHKFQKNIIYLHFPICDQNVIIITGAVVFWCYSVQTVTCPVPATKILITFKFKFTIKKKNSQHMWSFSGIHKNAKLATFQSVKLTFYLWLVVNNYFPFVMKKKFII